MLHIVLLTAHGQVEGLAYDQTHTTSCGPCMVLARAVVNSGDFLHPLCVLVLMQEVYAESWSDCCDVGPLASD
jgi:hypothetical protein